MTNNATTAPIVIKLGGSTSHAQTYKPWLKHIANARRRVIIVPGGGPYADVVRDTQASLDFNDATAHDLALLSMNQFGRVLLQHLSESQPLAQTADWHTNQSHLSVWLPDPFELIRDRAIERSWRTTGDTLSCWLCRALNATTLILIKSVATERLRQPLHQLAQHGIIDPLCEHWIKTHRLRVHLLGANDESQLSELLR